MASLEGKLPAQPADEVILMSDSSDISKTASPEAPASYQELMTLLVTLEHHIVLYPPAHDSIKRVTEALQKLLEALSEQNRSLTLLINHEKLTLNGCHLAAANPRNRKLALFFSQRSIITVTMERELTAKELVRFFEILHELPPKSDIRQFPSVAEAMGTLPHISITQFELKSLHVQNRDQVEAPVDNALTDDRWEKIIQSGAAGPDNTDFMRSLYSILPEFAPSLRESILSITSQNTDMSDGEQLIEALRKHIPSEMVIAMGMHALNDNRQISPALQKLLSTISLNRADSSGGPPPEQQSGVIGPIPSRSSLNGSTTKIMCPRSTATS